LAGIAQLVQADQEYGSKHITSASEIHLTGRSGGIVILLAGLVNSGPPLGVCDDDDLNQGSPITHKLIGVADIQLAENQHIDAAQHRLRRLPFYKVHASRLIPAAKEALRHDTDQCLVGKAMEHIQITFLVDGAQVHHGGIAPSWRDIVTGDHISAFVNDLRALAIVVDVLKNGGLGCPVTHDLGTGKSLFNIQIGASAGNDAHAAAHA
jgi:hypothetical protein